MRPRIQGQWSPGYLQWYWIVTWSPGPGSGAGTMFWTWAAAVDFACERVAEFKKKNHLHLWQ